MVYKYKLTPLAIDDIDEALDYIANYLDNKIAADDLMSQFKVLRFLYGKRLISQDIIM